MRHHRSLNSLPHMTLAEFQTDNLAAIEILTWFCAPLALLALLPVSELSYKSRCGSAASFRAPAGECHSVVLQAKESSSEFIRACRTLSNDVGRSSAYTHPTSRNRHLPHSSSDRRRQSPLPVIPIFRRARRNLTPDAICATTCCRAECGRSQCGPSASHRAALFSASRSVLWSEVVSAIYVLLPTRSPTRSPLTVRMSRVVPHDELIVASPKGALSV